MALAAERNWELIERDLRYAWWNNHAVVDAAIGTFIEYGTKDRRQDRDSYAEMWRRWIYDDYLWHRSWRPSRSEGQEMPSMIRGDGEEKLEFGFAELAE